MSNDKFVRWQGYSISQLTFALNLFLALSVGALAFGLKLLNDEKVLITGCSKYAFSLGLIAVIFSIILGCAAVISRLMDFRFTARKVRSDDKHDPDEESGVYKHRAACLGRLTWRLFWAELSTFAIGLVGLMIGLFSAYGTKLW